MKKKIIFAMDSLEGGGAEKVLIKILEKINFEKYDITLFLMKKEGVYLKNLNPKVTLKYLLNTKKSGFFQEKIIYSLKKRLFKLIFKFPNLINYLILENYDECIVFLEGKITNVFSKFKKAKKKIAWIHIDIFKEDKKEYDLNVYKESYDKIAVVSSDIKDSMRKVAEYLIEKTEVIYNPIDREEILEKSEEKIELPKDNYILTVARLDNSQKAIDKLLEAYKLLKEQGLQFKAIILGEGKDREVLEKFIKDNKLENYVELKGFVKNPYPFIKNSEFFVISSRAEGFSLVAAEAQILGKAIISTDCSGPRELLNNGKNGILVPIEDVNKLAEVIEKLLSDEKNRIQYSNLSLEKSKCYDLENTISKIENFMEDLL